MEFAGGLHYGKETKNQESDEYKGCKKEVRRRIQTGCMIWKKVSGVLCDRKLSASVKGKMYKSRVIPAMLYEMEMVAVMETQVGKWYLQS